MLDENQEVIFLLNEYMKKLLWVILLTLLVAAVLVMAFLYLAPEAAEHEYSGLFI